MNKKWMALVAASTLLIQSVPAYAEGPGRRGDFHHSRPNSHPKFHRDYVAHRLPAGYISLLVGGLTHLYCEGLFYRHTPSGYVVVQPPIGALVPALPPGYTLMLVNNRPYYVYGYTYYDVTPAGYMVVNPPAYAPQTITPVIAQSTVLPAPQPAAAVPQVQAAPAAPAENPSNLDTIEIHLPNGDGTFTLIKLKQTATGFLGPQGEFYPDHPTVDQLKERYIKQKA